MVLKYMVPISKYLSVLLYSIELYSKIKSNVKFNFVIGFPLYTNFFEILGDLMKTQKQKKKKKEKREKGVAHFKNLYTTHTPIILNNLY